MSTTKVHDFIILSNGSAKLDNAVSVYAKNLASALTCNGMSVLIICFTKDYSWQKWAIEGIDYHNANQQRRRIICALIRKTILLFHWYISSFVLIKSIKRQNASLKLIAIDDFSDISLYAVLLQKSLLISSYLNIIEHPQRCQKRFASELVQSLTAKSLTGFVTISRALMVDLRLRNCLIMPPVIDYSSLTKKTLAVSHKGRFIIGYCGTVTNEKDGIDLLIKGLSCLSDYARNHVSLMIIGDTHGGPLSFDQFKKDAAQSCPCVEFHFLGRIENKYVMQRLEGCDLLVLSRPDNFQNKYGFPSKLPEYLATGVPVLVSRVSDIPDYLVDGESAYLLDSVEPAHIASRIEYVMDHYEEAKKVGLGGLEVARNVFSNKVQGRRLLDFIGCREGSD